MTAESAAAPILEAGSQPMKRLEFHVIYKCVDACLFCSEQFHMREFGGFPVPREEVFRMLEDQREAGFEHVTLTGGEPTLYPRFWEVAARAKELGYRVFVISNGSALGLKDYAEKLLPHVDELCLSIHGHTAELHDKLTQKPRSFERLAAALENIEAHPAAPFVMINNVVTRLNVEHLPDILDFVTRTKKVRHYLLSNVTPHGGGGEKYADLAVRHEEITSQLPRLAGLAASRGVALRVYGVPVCLLGPYARLSNDLFYSPRTTISRTWETAADGTSKPGWHFERAELSYREKVYPEACRDCSLNGRCGGVYGKYQDLFGPEALRAYTPASLRAAMETR